MLSNLKVLSIRNLLHLIFLAFFIGAVMGLGIDYNLHGWQFLVFLSGLFAVHTIQNGYKQYPIDYIHFCAFPLSKTKIFNTLVVKNFTEIYMFAYILAMIAYLSLCYFGNNQMISFIEFIIIFEIYILFIVMIVPIQFFCRRNKRFFTISGVGLPLLMLLLLIIISRDTLNISAFNVDYAYLSLILGVLCLLSYIIAKRIFLQYVSKIGFKKAVYIEE
jgi:hypothetical protein